MLADPNLYLLPDPNLYLTSVMVADAVWTHDGDEDTWDWSSGSATITYNTATSGAGWLGQTVMMESGSYTITNWDSSSGTMTVKESLDGTFTTGTVVWSGT